MRKAILYIACLLTGVLIGAFITAYIAQRAKPCIILDPSLLYSPDDECLAFTKVGKLNVVCGR